VYVAATLAASGVLDWMRTLAARYQGFQKDGVLAYLAETYGLEATPSLGETLMKQAIKADSMTMPKVTPLTTTTQSKPAKKLKASRSKVTATAAAVTTTTAPQSVAKRSSPGAVSMDQLVIPRKGVQQASTPRSCRGPCLRQLGSWLAECGTDWEIDRPAADSVLCAHGRIPWWPDQRDVRHRADPCGCVRCEVAVRGVVVGQAGAVSGSSLGLILTRFNRRLIV
jgi:hypothetical protein